MSLQKTSWHVLAVVPASRQIGELHIANVIAQVSWKYQGDPVVVLDLRDVSLRLLDHYKKEMDEHVKNGRSVIMALSSIEQNPTTIAFARAADAAVLVVKLDETSMKSATFAVEEIGHDKFAGMILSHNGARA
jgi:hypothetical protein